MPQLSARERLVGATIDLVRRRGAAGMGVSELIAESGVARRSLYLNFPGGKDELIVEATDAAGRFISRAIRDGGTPQEVLHGLVAMWREVLVKSEFEAGCPVAAAALANEAAPSAPGAAAKAFGAWQARLAARLTEAGLPAAEATGFATVALAAIEGAVLLAVAERSVNALDQVEAHLVTTIGARLTPGD